MARIKFYNKNTNKWEYADANNSGVDIDSTLSEEGKAADAKAVGNAVDQIKSEKQNISNLTTIIDNNSTDEQYPSVSAVRDYVANTTIGMKGTANNAEIFNYSDNVASMNGAHAEGYKTTASGYNSHAEGKETVAAGNESHVEGNSTSTGLGANSSHAEGHSTQAKGEQSHAEGWGTIASGKCTHVQGKFNIDQDVASNKYAEYAHIIGNGKSNSDRSNAHTLDWDGNAWFAGDVYVGGTGQRDILAKRVVASNKYTIQVFGGEYENLPNYANTKDDNGNIVYRPYHGSCTLIHGAGRSFLFDLGAIKMHEASASGLDIPLIKYMDSNISKPLTAIFISHFHNDHYSFENINYLRTQGWIDKNTMVVFPSAPNLPSSDSRKYSTYRGYLIYCFNNLYFNGEFNYKTSGEKAYIKPGYSTGIAELVNGREITINEPNIIKDGDILTFGDVSIECYNIDAGIDANCEGGKYKNYILDNLTKTTDAKGNLLHEGGNYNAYSMINVVNIQGQRIVFTGDIAEPAQEDYAHVLTEPAALMFIPHHGLDVLISSALFNRMQAKYAVEHSIFSSYWRKNLCNAFIGELAKSGCCALNTFSGDVVFEIENFQLRKIKGGKDNLCPNIYAACAIKPDADLTDLLPGQYMTYDNDIAKSICNNNGLTKLADQNGNYPTFSVCVETIHHAPDPGPCLKRITVTPHNTNITSIAQAIKIQNKLNSIIQGWSTWYYINITNT